MTQKLHFQAAVFSGYFDLINLSDIVIALMTWDGVTDSLPKIYWRRLRRAQTFLCYALYETSRNTQTSFQKYKYTSRTLSDSKESLGFLLLSSRFWILFKRNCDVSSISYWHALIKFNLIKILRWLKKVLWEQVHSHFQLSDNLNENWNNSLHT